MTSMVLLDRIAEISPDRREGFALFQSQSIRATLIITRTQRTLGTLR